MHFEWEALEYEPRAKSPSWSAAIVIGAGVIILIAALMKNFLLAVLVLLAAFALILHGHKSPEQLLIIVNRHGVRVRHLLYPFNTLRSFWVHDDLEEKKMTLRSEKAFMPYLHLPLPDDLDHEALRLFLLEHLEEDRPEPTIIDALVEYL
ncbi:MAG: hypothetical protein AAB455_03195 [Patescibacteria group bacterium]